MAFKKWVKLLETSSLEHIEMDDWTIIPCNCFKILSKYIEKVTRSIHFKCNIYKL